MRVQVGNSGMALPIEFSDCIVLFWTLNFREADFTSGVLFFYWKMVSTAKRKVWHFTNAIGLWEMTLYGYCYRTVRDDALLPLISGTELLSFYFLIERAVTHPCGSHFVLSRQIQKWALKPKTKTKINRPLSLQVLNAKRRYFDLFSSLKEVA